MGYIAARYDIELPRQFLRVYGNAIRAKVYNIMARNGTGHRESFDHNHLTPCGRFQGFRTLYGAVPGKAHLVQQDTPAKDAAESHVDEAPGAVQVVLIYLTAKCGKRPCLRKISEKTD
jgi:hypothetical protein